MQVNGSNVAVLAEHDTDTMIANPTQFIGQTVNSLNFTLPVDYSVYGTGAIYVKNNYDGNVMVKLEAFEKVAVGAQDDNVLSVTLIPGASYRFEIGAKAYAGYRLRVDRTGAAPTIGTLTVRFSGGPLTNQYATKWIPLEGETLVGPTSLAFDWYVNRVVHHK